MGLELVVAALLSFGGGPLPCTAPPTRGPAVPAPLVFRTSCGAFRLDASGRVTRLPREWLAAHAGGTKGRFGAELSIRRTPDGSLALRDGRRVVWRASRRYRNDAATVAFGPHRFAFGVYRRGVFVTDLRRPERLVLRGQGFYPYDYTSSGRLIVTGNRQIVVVAPDGNTARRYRYRTRHGLGFDADRDALYFVRPDGRLVVLEDGRGPRPLRRVRGDLGWLTLQRSLLVFEGRQGVVVMERKGRVLAAARWPLPAPFALDALSVSPDGRALAFRLADTRPGGEAGRAAVFLLRRGAARPAELFRRRLGPVGCGTGATLSWHGDLLLHRSSEGDVLVTDTRSRRLRDLTRLGRNLPRRSPADEVLVDWRSDYPR